MTLPERAAQLFLASPPPAPAPSDTGAVPQQVHNGCDTCATPVDPDAVHARGKGKW